MTETAEFTKPARDEVRKTQNRHLTMFEKVFKKLAQPYRRTFGEIELMLVKKDGADLFVEESIQKMTQFIQAELSKTGTPILFQGEGEVPSVGSCYVINVCGSRVNLVHGRSDILITCAHINNGVADCAASYNPVTDILYAAERSQGAVATNMRLRVSGREYVEGTMVGVFSPVTRTEDEDAFLSVFKKLRAHSVHVRTTGNTMVDVLDVCAGRLEAFVGMNLSVHDVLVAELFVRESGGYTCEIDGSKVELGSTTFVACNHKYQGRLLKSLK